MTVDIFIVRTGQEFRIWSEDGEWVKFELLDTNTGKRAVFETSFETASQIGHALRGYGH